MGETPGSQTVSTKLGRIAKMAKQMRGVPLTTLAHHIDKAWLCEAYRRTRKDGAVGIDGQSAQQYEEKLERNLEALLERAKAGTYQAPAVRRVHIPKGDGSKTRPIGIPTFEDKVLQRAVHMVLEAVYEQDFRPCSYGFRPGRGAHQACDALWRAAMDLGGGWVLEVDIEKYFDSLVHEQLQVMLSQRVRDGVLLRLIGKWLNAGVMEGSELHHPEAGTPQGGVISPLLANIYLHEVMDEWFEQQVRPRLKGRASLVRYADDLVIVFEREADAKRVLDVLSKRFAQYGLKLHPDKTRLVPFNRPRWIGRGGRRPGTLDFLGFTFYWGRARSGAWVVKKRTAKDRISRTLRRINEWCRTHRHDDVEKQQRALAQKLNGHYAYFGVTSNYEALARVLFETEGIWRRWLSRRSRRAFKSWVKMKKLMQRYPLPRPRIVHRAAHGIA